MLPVPVVTRALAGVLALCVAVLAGWILFVDEPFGGEPVAVVSAVTAAAEAKPAAEPARAKPSARAAAPPRPRSKTVTIIDGSTGKRQEVSVGAGRQAPTGSKKN